MIQEWTKKGLSESIYQWKSCISGDILFGRIVLFSQIHDSVEVERIDGTLLRIEAARLIKAEKKLLDLAFSLGRCFISQKESVTV